MNINASTTTKLHYYLWYFLIFSILGLILETFFCYVTTGIIESRKAFFIGPFCPVYGAGAVSLIWVLKRFNKNIPALFFFGIVIASAVEYVFDFVFEAICGINFWNYTYLPFNLNGRICILFSFFWGILAILLIKVMKPAIDRLINKIFHSLKFKLDIPILAFLVLNLIITVWAINTYVGRNTSRKLNASTNTDWGTFEATKLLVEDAYFTNERLLLTFPNLRYKDELGNEIFIRDNLKNF